MVLYIVDILSDTFRELPYSRVVYIVPNTCDNIPSNVATLYNHLEVPLISGWIRVSSEYERGLAIQGIVNTNTDWILVSQRPERFAMYNPEIKVEQLDFEIEESKADSKLMSSSVEIPQARPQLPPFELVYNEIWCQYFRFFGASPEGQPKKAKSFRNMLTGFSKVAASKSKLSSNDLDHVQMTEVVDQVYKDLLQREFILKGGEQIHYNADRIEQYLNNEQFMKFVSNKSLCSMAITSLNKPNKKQAEYNLQELATKIEARLNKIQATHGIEENLIHGEELVADILTQLHTIGAIEIDAPNPDSVIAQFSLNPLCKIVLK